MITLSGTRRSLTPARPYDGAVTSTAPSIAASNGSWFAPIVRALPAVAAGLTITFTADHSSAVGLVMLAVFGLGSATVLLVTALRLPRADALAGLHRPLALLAATVGALAVIVLVAEVISLPVLLLLVGGYAVLAGAFELVWGIRHRGRSGFARDAIVIGTGTLALALVLAFVGDPVSAVGFFGAYAVILGVYLVIAGLSLKWSPPATESTES